MMRDFPPSTTIVGLVAQMSAPTFEAHRCRVGIGGTDANIGDALYTHAPRAAVAPPWRSSHDGQHSSSPGPLLGVTEDDRQRRGQSWLVHVATAQPPRVLVSCCRGLPADSSPRGREQQDGPGVERVPQPQSAR